MITQLRLAFRSLAKAPGFTVVAILTLALGIGLSTGSFSMANAFLLRTVPYPEADRIVRIFRTSSQSQRMSHAPANVLDLREATTSYSSFALVNFDNYAFGEPGQPAQQTLGLCVTSDFFSLIGVQPVIGRGFAPGDDQPDKPHIAVLTHRGWTRHFGANPAVVGRTVRLNAETYTVVGILPETFDAPLVWSTVEFVMPRTLYSDFRTARSGGWIDAIARLKPGVTLRQAQAELDTLGARLRQQYPKENG